ncbi:MAG: UDP-N-acetylmuramate--alanine ligase [Ferruginibacter sp.]|nr:UDP-N-acetylmuramate--alanine ligase [Ferruginibacter sp.]
MSALAQFLSGTGKHVSGSDRYFIENQYNETKEKLEAENIKCFSQNGEGITSNIELVIVSTAIEDTVPEVQKAKELGITIIKRSDLLALIAASKRTIAVGGTSGKSTTGGMLFQILETAGYDPGIISGAGLVSIINEGKIGNAKVGTGDWLIIEADESDGSIVKYKPEIGLLLNIDKDHQEIDELIEIFTTFKENTKGAFVVNRSNKLSATLSSNIENDFSSNEKEAGYKATNLVQNGMNISFNINNIPFNLKTIGKHNMENALAATAVANSIGISLELCAKGLEQYDGIYRRHQLLGIKNGITVLDDYAHNPAKCAASIMACQPIAPKVIAWFQPHGYGPTRFLRNDFVAEIAAALRPQDEIWMSEIFYAGGTAVKDISANDLINDIKALGKNAFFVEDRNNLLTNLSTHFTNDCVLLLMGARDPGLEIFSKNLYQQL